MTNALFNDCETCGGDGNEILPVNRSKSSLGPCLECKGWGIRPTEVGQPFFEMVNRMRQAQHHRNWPGGSDDDVPSVQ